MSIEITTNVKEGQFKYRSPMGVAGTLPDVSTLQVEERGAGDEHLTIIRAVGLVMTSAAGQVPANDEEMGALIYTFPTGEYQIHWARMDVTGLSVGDNDVAGEYALGSTLAAGDTATIGAATDEDVIDGQTVADLSSPALDFDSASEDTTMRGGTGDTVTVSTLHFNLAGAFDTASTADPTVTGTFYIKWTYWGAD